MVADILEILQISIQAKKASVVASLGKCALLGKYKKSTPPKTF